MKRKYNWKLIGITLLIITLITPGILLYLRFGNSFDYTKEIVRLDNHSFFETIKNEGEIDYTKYSHVLVESDEYDTPVAYAVYGILLTEQEIEDSLSISLILPNSTSRIILGEQSGYTHYLFKQGDTWYMTNSPSPDSLYSQEAFISGIRQVRD